jgi:hypothetical protein
VSRFARLLSFVLFFSAASLPAQDSKIMGELRFDPLTSVDRDAGIWVDGNYVGYVKELMKDRHKKVLLLPGKHTVTARQAGYTDWTKEVVVDPGEINTLHIQMTMAPGAKEPQVTVELKVTIKPSRAAVFVDGAYVGHAGELGGAVHSLLLAPGNHHIKVSLPGYRDFQTDVTLVAGQKSEVKTELLKATSE